MDRVMELIKGALIGLPDNAWEQVSFLPVNMQVRMTSNGGYIRVFSAEFVGCSKEWPLSKRGLRAAFRY